jgi:hypothetical protein
MLAHRESVRGARRAEFRGEKRGRINVPAVRQMDEGVGNPLTAALKAD